MRRLVVATRRATPAPGLACERMSARSLSARASKMGCSFVLLPSTTWLLLIRRVSLWSSTFSDHLPRRRLKTTHACQYSSGFSSCQQTWTSCTLLQSNHELRSHFPVASMNHGQRICPAGPECGCPCPYCATKAHQSQKPKAWSWWD